MTVETLFSNWLALVGGVSGLALLLYFGAMVHFARKKDKEMQRLEVRLARIEGLLLGRRSR